MRRRTLIQNLCLPTVTGLAWPAIGQQGPYPSKPVKIIIGFGPGSGSDLLARMFADELQKIFGPQFVVENRPGASVMIAASAVKAAAPDGYTLLLTSSTSHSVNPFVFKKLPYDPVADFTPIGSIGLFPAILAVNADTPVRSIQEFIPWAQARRGDLFYAYSSLTFRIAAESLNRLKMLNAKGVPYKSSPEAMTDVLGNRAQFLVVDLASSQALVKAGRLRALAVTSGKRTVLAPDLPTIEESLGLRDFDMPSWAGLFGPANLPADVVEALSGALTRTMARPEIRARMLATNIEPLPATPVEFKAFIGRQLAIWKQKVQEAGVEPE
jgi:tripartite-type tricarboxylate transporter receptor subunit TctC